MFIRLTAEIAKINWSNRGWQTVACMLKYTHLVACLLDMFFTMHGKCDMKLTNSTNSYFASNLCKISVITFHPHF